MGVIKDYVNQGFTVGDITVSTFDETGARIRIKDFYDLDLMERKRIVDFAGKVDVELINTENKITVETEGKLAEYYKSSEIETKFYNKTDTDNKFYNKTETDSKLNTYATKSEISAGYVPKTLEAQETIKGITNFKDMKKQVNHLSGAEYKDNNEFGSNLKNITKGEVYYYGTKPYMAIKTGSNITGFLAPDNTNFTDITNKNLDSLLSTNLLNYAEYKGAVNQDSTFKFFKFGKFAFFHINYYFSPAVIWPAKVAIADYPTGFKPNGAFMKTQYSVTNWNDGNKTNLLLDDKLYLTGHDPAVHIAAIRGTIMYITE